MPVAAQILAVLAAAIHVLFFYLESIAFMKPAVSRTFGASNREQAELLRGIFLNQGFYNLFLAIGVVAGVLYAAYGSSCEVILLSDPAQCGSLNGGETASWGPPVVFFGLACMVGAALVLLISSKGAMLRGALIQGLVPLAGLLVMAFG